MVSHTYLESKGEISQNPDSSHGDILLWSLVSSHITKPHLVTRGRHGLMLFSVGVKIWNDLFFFVFRMLKFSE